MSRKNQENSLEAQALALAQKGIEASAAEQHDEAVVHWRAALAYTDIHLPGADISFWIRSGLGAALYDAGAYEESIAISKDALDWCAGLKQPFAALTLAKSYRRLGDEAKAQTFLSHARNLAGDSVLDSWNAG